MQTETITAPSEVELPAESPKQKGGSVARIRWRGALKELVFDEGGKPLLVPRSASVTKGDVVTCDVAGNATIVCENGDAVLLPAYAETETAQVGALRLTFLIKEITEPDEMTAYESLARYHYRGRVLCGRTARLVIRNFHPAYPEVVGFVELATPFYMNKARAAIFDAPFEDGAVEWPSWNKPTVRRYINTVVRIARCVVYPEFRGLGLGQMLLRHAAVFARRSWQVAKLKPHFLEISADMLKFVPFAERSGLTYVGDTEGNLARVARDMGYLLLNQDRVRAREIVREEALGIVDKQVSRMNRAADLMTREGWSREELVERLQKLARGKSWRDLRTFHEIISLPKPTFMRGLTEKAEEFIKCRVEAMGISPTHSSPTFQVEAFSGPLVLADISVRYSSSVRRTRRTQAVQQAFDISTDLLTHHVAKELNLQASAGDVILITGPSGSGKTSLIRVLEGKQKPTTGSIARPRNYRVGTFRSIESGKPMVEVIGGGSVQDSLSLMGLVGLSDAHVYLKRFHELSNGQQYRAMLARLITSQANVWLADEFCSNLDVVTANVVADRLQRLARQMGSLLIVASSNPSPFARALKPTAVVQLTSAWEHQVIPGDEFLDRMARQVSRFSIPTLRVNNDEVEEVRTGSRRMLVHHGKRPIACGPLVLEAKNQRVIAMVRSSSFVPTDFTASPRELPALSPGRLRKPNSGSHRLILTTVNRPCDE